MDRGPLFLSLSHCQLGDNSFQSQQATCPSRATKNLVGFLTLSTKVPGSTTFYFLLVSTFHSFRTPTASPITELIGSRFHNAAAAAAAALKEWTRLPATPRTRFRPFHRRIMAPAVEARPLPSLRRLLPERAAKNPVLPVIIRGTSRLGGQAMGPSRIPCLLFLEIRVVVPPIII